MFLRLEGFSWENMICIFFVSGFCKFILRIYFKTGFHLATRETNCIYINKEIEDSQRVIVFCMTPNSTGYTGAFQKSRIM